MNDGCVRANRDGHKVAVMLLMIPAVEEVMSRDDSGDDCRVDKSLYRHHLDSQ